MKKHFLLYLVVILLLPGCTYRLGDFTVISTKNVELGAKYERIGQGEAKDEVFVFYIPFGSPNIESAVDRLLDEKGGDLLTNAVMSSYNYSFLIGVMGYKIKGDVWKRVSLSELTPGKEYFNLEKSGNEFVLVSSQNPDVILKVEHRKP